MLDGFPSLTIGAIRELSQHRQWVLWRLEKKASGDFTKIPYSALTHRPASSTNPGDWASFHQVVDASVKHDGQPYSGAGFVFSEKAANRILGVDLDKCRDIETEQLDDWAQAIVDRFHTYAEVSPSGRGVHILCRGTLTDARVKKFGKIELYSWGRYFTVTGDHLPGTGEEIEECQDALDWLVDYMAGLKAAKQSPGEKFLEAREAAPTQVNGHNLTEANGHALNGHDFRTADSAPAATKTKAALNLAEFRSRLQAELDPHARADAQVNDKLLVALMANNERFKETWERSRADTKDWSHSEYDLALASWMVAASWAPVEVMCALIAYRRRWGGDLKIERAPKSYYYVNTIMAAQRRGEEEEAQQDIRNFLSMKAERGEEKPSPAELDSVHKALGVIYGCDIKAVLRYTGDEPLYAIMTAKGEVKADANVLMSQTMLAKAFLTVTKLVIAPCRPAQHRDRIQSMLDAAADVEVGGDARLVELVRHWLTEYLTTKEMRQANGVISNDPNEPFMKDGFFCLALPAFAKWLAEQRGQRYTIQKLAVELRKLKCDPITENFRFDERDRQRKFWRVPPVLLT
ncbi:MAG: hypothetical protein WA210_00840 [Burkholderiaceae bacterium]